MKVKYILLPDFDLPLEKCKACIYVIFDEYLKTTTLKRIW